MWGVFAFVGLSAPLVTVDVHARVQTSFGSLADSTSFQRASRTKTSFREAVEWIVRHHRALAVLCVHTVVCSLCDAVR